MADGSGTGLPPCPTFKCRSLCDLVGVSPGPADARTVAVTEEWSSLHILPASPWPGTHPSAPRLRVPLGSQGGPSTACPGLSSSSSIFVPSGCIPHGSMCGRGQRPPPVHQRKSSETFFLVHSALASEHTMSRKCPLGQPRAGPPPFGSLSRCQEVQLGGCGPFPVSSFHRKSRVHPATVAQGGSSVSRGGVATSGPFPRGAGRGPRAWFWHRQRLAHACGAQAQSTGSGTHVCPGHGAAACSA